MPLTEIYCENGDCLQDGADESAGWSRACVAVVWNDLNVDECRRMSLQDRELFGQCDCIKEYRGFEAWWFSRVSDGFQYLDAL